MVFYKEKISLALLHIALLIIFYIIHYFILSFLSFLLEIFSFYGNMFIEVSCIDLYSDSFKLSYLSLHWEICSNFYSLNLI